LASSTFGGCSFRRTKSHSAVQRSPRSLSSAIFSSRSALAVSFCSRASLRYRTARGLLMASRSNATEPGLKRGRPNSFRPHQKNKGPGARSEGPLTARVHPPDRSFRVSCHIKRVCQCCRRSTGARPYRMRQWTSVLRQICRIAKAALVREKARCKAGISSLLK
jgi:hypothetical protein